DNKDTKFKKKKSFDRDSGLGVMTVGNNSHHFASIQKKPLKYGYFDQESEGDGFQKDRFRRGSLPNGDLSPGLIRPSKSKYLPEPLNVSVTSSSRSTPSPMATTPPLVSNSRSGSRGSRQYPRERKFSSSNSSESSASCDDGIRTHGNRRASQYSQYLGKSQCYNVVPQSWNGELDYYEENYYNDHEPRNPKPSSTTVRPVSRVRNLSLNLTVPRSDPFTRNITSTRRASDCAISSGATPITEKEKKSMKIAEYHKYQEENIAAQYHKYRVNPLPVAGEEITPVRPMTPTLLHIQQEYKSVNARRFVDLNDGVSSPGRHKRTSQIETSRRISMTESNSGRTRKSQSFTAGKPPAGRPEHRKNQSETTIMQQQLHMPRAPQPQRHASSSIHLSSQFQNSATSLSSSGSTSGSGGPPTPNGKQSSVFGSSNTPSSVDDGCIKDKRKRNTLSVVNRQLSDQNGIY
ncbi:7151_t:CDS:2, partial [Acaulospora morrowiae]